MAPIRTGTCRTRALLLAPTILRIVSSSPEPEVVPTPQPTLPRPRPTPKRVTRSAIGSSLSLASPPPSRAPTAEPSTSRTTGVTKPKAGPKPKPKARPFVKKTAKVPAKIIELSDFSDAELVKPKAMGIAPAVDIDAEEEGVKDRKVEKGKGKAVPKSKGTLKDNPNSDYNDEDDDKPLFLPDIRDIFSPESSQHPSSSRPPTALPVPASQPEHDAGWDDFYCDDADAIPVVPRPRPRSPSPRPPPRPAPRSTARATPHHSQRRQSKQAPPSKGRQSLAPHERRRVDDLDSELNDFEHGLPAADPLLSSPSTMRAGVELVSTPSQTMRKGGRNSKGKDEGKERRGITQQPTPPSRNPTPRRSSPPPRPGPSRRRSPSPPPRSGPSNTKRNARRTIDVSEAWAYNVDDLDEQQLQAIAIAADVDLRGGRGALDKEQMDTIRVAAGDSGGLDGYGLAGGGGWAGRGDDEEMDEEMATANAAAAEWEAKDWERRESEGRTEGSREDQQIGDECSMDVQSIPGRSRRPPPPFQQNRWPTPPREDDVFDDDHKPLFTPSPIPEVVELSSNARDIRYLFTPSPIPSVRELSSNAPNIHYLFTPSPIPNVLELASDAHDIRYLFTPSPIPEVLELSSNAPNTPLNFLQPSLLGDEVQPLKPKTSPNTTTTAMALILEMIPEVDPEYLLTLVETHLPTYGPDQIIEFIVSHLFEKPGYPRVERRMGKGKGKACEGGGSSSAKRKAGGKDEEGGGHAKKPRIDYASGDRPFRGGANYHKCAITALQLAFPAVPLPYLRKKLANLNGLYAPTYLEIRDEEARVERAGGIGRLYKPKEGDGAVAAKGKGQAIGDEEFEEEEKWLEEYLESGGLPLSASQGAGNAGNEANAEDEDEDHDKEELEDDGTFVECGCCFGTYPFDRMTACPNIHLFCRSCIRRYASNELSSHNCVLKCMHMSGCTSLFPESELRRLLPQKLFHLYSRLKQQQELKEAGIEGLEECPFCDWACVMEASKDVDRLFRCGNEEGCGVVSCRMCKKREHVPKTCKEAEDKNLVGRVAIEEAMTKALMRSCPKCSKEFIKSDGCNKMTCPNCQTLSCYVCKRAIANYSHFDQVGPRKGRRSSTNSKCPLWDDSVDQRHDEDVNEAYYQALKQYRRDHPDVELGKDFEIYLRKAPPK